MGNSTADCHQQAMMRSFAVVLLLFSSGVLADLECWEGGCGGPGEDPCTDSDPSLNKTICKAPVDMCAKAEGNINSASFKYWGCDMKENSETGCYDVTDDLNDQLGNGLGIFSDVEGCFCDTALCNSATKQTFAAIFAVLIVIHLIY